MKNLLVIFGSTRPSRVGLPVGQWMTAVAGETDLFDVSFVDLADLELPLLDEAEHPARQQYTKTHTRRWSALAGAADAYVFVTPEYDYFPPAALVNAIQFLSKEWSGKPAGIVSYGGISGGLRATQALRLLMSGVNLMALGRSVSLPFFADAINSGGKLVPDERTHSGALALVRELDAFLAN